jgi:hypothetical protein
MFLASSVPIIRIYLLCSRQLVRFMQAMCPHPSRDRFQPVSASWLNYTKSWSAYGVLWVQLRLLVALFLKLKFLSNVSQKIWYHFWTFFRFKKSITFFRQHSTTTPLTKRESASSLSGFWGENNKLETVVSLLVIYQTEQFVVMGHGKVKNHNHDFHIEDSLKEKVFNL